MPILIAGDGLKKNNEYYEQKIHNLIVNDVEKYRLVKNSNTLVYAKGKINFDLNDRYLDSNGQEHFVLNRRFSWDWRKIPESLFAFYEDGFYYKDNKKQSSFNQCELPSLTEMMKTKWITDDGWRGITPITFQGWYFSSSTREWKIDTIKDVYTHTDLFNFKSDTSLPEITLYAKWKIPTYTLTVHNITKYGYNKRIAKSSFYDKQKKKTFKGDSSRFTISYNTDLKKFLKNNISNVKYRTWAYDALDGTRNQQSLRKGPQKFLGWSNEQYVYDNGFKCHGPTNFDLASSTIPARVDVYPQFKTIIVVKKANFKSNTFYYDNQRKKKTVSAAGGKYLLRETVDNTEVKAENSIYVINAGVQLEYFRFTKKKNGEYDKHYRYIWAPPERADYYSTAVDHDKVPYSSTIVYKIRSVAPYDWQRGGYY